MEVSNTLNPYINYSSENKNTIDGSNISVKEINSLIKSGKDELLNVVPLIQPSLIEKYGPEQAMNIKMDFVQQIENNISFKQHLNEDTSLLEEALKILKEAEDKPFSNTSAGDTYY